MDYVAGFYNPAVGLNTNSSWKNAFKHGGRSCCMAKPPGNGKPRRPPPLKGPTFRDPASEVPYRRGEIIQRLPARPSSLPAIGVRVSPTGMVERPWYKPVNKELGSITLAGYAHIPGFSRAERRERHRLAGVVEEYTRLKNACLAFETLQQLTVQHGLPTGEKKRELIITLIKLKNTIALYPRLKTKKDSIKKVKRAIELLENNNVIAFTQQLEGIVGDLYARRSTLNKQNPRLERDIELFIRESDNYKQKGLGRMAETDQLFERTKNGKLSPREQRELSAIFHRRAVGYGKQNVEATTEEGQALESAYMKLSDLLKEGINDSNRREFLNVLTRTRNWLSVRYARNFIMTSDMLRSVAKWKPGMRMKVITMQLKLAEENMEYWLAYGNVKWLFPWLLTLSNTMAADAGHQTMQRLISQAAFVAKKENYAGAQQKLLEALHATS